MQTQTEVQRLTVVNVVATAELGQLVDLEKLVGVKGFLYDEAIYHCAYLKDENTRAKVSIFGSGKMICVGAKSLWAATRDLNYAARRLTKLRLISTRRITPQLQNIVATANLGRAIDIERLARKLPHIIYEPEQFPGAIFYADELQGASILIFSNGKVVLAGLRRREMLKVGQRVLRKLCEVIS